MRPYVGYVRVSRVGDREGRLISPELQAERIRSYASARGLDVELLEPELDVSGGKVERPILSAAIEAIEAGRFAGIIVAQLDRLSRMSLVDALHTIRRIEDAGGEVLAAGESFDTTTPEGRMGRNVFLSMAEMQLGRYQSQFAAAKVRAVQQGIWPFPIVPIGYRKGPDRRLAVDPRTAPKVRRAFELRAQGAPWSQISELLAKGQSGASKVIRNRVYLGEISIERLGVRNPSAHQPLVERGLWEAAQLQHPRPPRGESGPALLSGLVRCAGCSRSMSPGIEKGKRRYRCFPRKARGRCPEPASIAASLIEPLVEHTFLAHVDVVAEGRPHTDTLAQAQRSLDSTEAELEAFQRETKASEVDPRHFASGLRERAEAVDDARQQLGEAQAIQQPGASLRRLSAEWPKMGIEQRRHVLRSALGVVWVRKGQGPDRIKVIATGFEPRNLSRPGRLSPAQRINWTTLPGELRIVGS